jgi:hypothetical protein
VCGGGGCSSGGGGGGGSSSSSSSSSSTVSSDYLDFGLKWIQSANIPFYTWIKMALFAFKKFALI